MRLILLLILISDFSFSQINFLASKDVPYRKGDKWGYADKTTGRITLDAVYDSVNFYSWSNLPLVYKNGKCGLYQYNKSTPLKLVIPIENDSIISFYQWFYLTVNNGKLRYLNSDFKSPLNDEFEDYYYGGYLVLKRGGNKPDVLMYNQQVIVDSVFTIHPIGKMEMRSVERSVYDQLKIKQKPAADQMSGNGTGNNPKQVYEVYDLIFVNTKGEQYLLNKDFNQFIKIPAVNLDSMCIHSVRKNENDFEQKHFSNEVLPLQIDRGKSSDEKIHRSGKTKYKFLTDAIGDYYRIIENVKSGYDGVYDIKTDSVSVTPEYKNVELYKFPYNKEYLIVVTQADNKKKIIYRNNLIPGVECDSMKFYFDEIWYWNKGLLGFAFLSMQTREYSVIPAKFKYALNSVLTPKEVLKVYLPDDSFYFVSKSGVEFYEK